MKLTNTTTLGIRLLTLAAVAATAVMVNASSLALAQQGNGNNGSGKKQVLNVRSMPVSAALEGAEAALQASEAEGHRVSVMVVDQPGNEKVLLRSDGAGPHTIASSKGKAFTAASLRRASRTLGAGSRPMPASSAAPEVARAGSCERAQERNRPGAPSNPTEPRSRATTRSAAPRQRSRR